MWFGNDDGARGAGEDAASPLITDPMATTTLQQVWEALPRSNGLPRRADLDPLHLGALIADCFVADRIAPGVARIRVAGRNLARYPGTEPRGLPLTAMFEGGHRDELGRCIEMCFDEPALIDLPVAAAQGLGRPPLAGRLMLLPMRDEMGLVTKAVGGLFVSGRIGRGPRKFRIDDSLPKRKMPLAAAAAMADRRSAGRPNLQLVVDNSH